MGPGFSIGQCGFTHVLIEHSSETHLGNEVSPLATATTQVSECHRHLILVLLFSHLVKGQEYLQLEALKGAIRCLMPNSGPGVKLTLTKRLWT